MGLWIIRKEHYLNLKGRKQQEAGENYIIRCWTIKSRNTTWEWCVACIGEMRNAYKILVGKPEGKKPYMGA
jgi:hypothetical protein